MQIIQRNPVANKTLASYNFHYKHSIILSTIQKPKTNKKGICFSNVARLKVFLYKGFIYLLVVLLGRTQEDKLNYSS